MNSNTWQHRAFGPATSVISLAIKGGAVLGGIWISAKGTSNTFTAADTASTTPVFTTRKFVSSVTSLAKGAIYQFGGANGIECGYGLAVRCVSMTGTILWRPSSAGV